MRIGAVSYLNTKPLVYGMTSRSAGDTGAEPLGHSPQWRATDVGEEVELLYDLPSRLADRLADRELDVALIPVIESVSDPDYVIVSNACIACRGPVWSVKLLSRVPLPQIGSIALDEGSRTSVALVQILLDRRFGVRPDLGSLPIGSSPENADTDSVLLIGDRAMHDWTDEFPYQWDLGQEWTAWDGHPFVFAVWTARKESIPDSLDTILQESRDLGTLNLDVIAAHEAAGHQLSVEQCLSYLRDNLHFRLAKEEKNGLRRFLSEAKRLGIIPSYSELSFHDCQAAG